MRTIQISDRKIGDRKIMQTIRQFIFLSAIFLSAAVPESRLFAGPRVDIVIGEKAPALERLAADELSSQLKRVYEADVKIGSTVPSDASHVIFVGSPETNANMKPFAGSWPSGDKKLTDQGHLLRSVTHNNRPALLIGGGSPVATYWAVAEFGHRLGIRSMLFGDLDPVSPPEFSLAAVDAFVEPSPRHRGWQFGNWSYADSGCWSTEEFRLVLRQLAKLRFNHVTINLSGSQPYIHLDYAGVSRSTSALFRTQTPSIVVSGDTLGRKAFGSAKLFEHPNFVGADSYTRRRERAETHLRAIIAAAQELGIRVDLSIHIGSVGDFPAEFAKVAGERVPKDGNTFSPRLSQLPNKPELAEFVKAWIEAIVKNYPTIDGLQINSYDLEERAVEWLVEKTGPLKRADGREIPLTRRQYSKGKWMVMPFNETQSSLPAVMDLPFDESSFGVLPSCRPQFWEADWEKIVRRGCGFEVTESDIGELDLPVYWLSRNSCQQSLSPMQACRELLAPVCGEEVDHRVWKAIELVELVVEDSPIDGTGIGIENNLKETFALPKAWNVARDNYLNAMNEMYRANTRAREGGRAYTLYLARRFEFAYEYMNCVEAVRKSAIAERDNDRDTQIAEIEKAIESLNNALNAMAEVARSNSDRGLIAVLNENGYRPLKKKLAEAEAAK